MTGLAVPHVIFATLFGILVVFAPPVAIPIPLYMATDCVPHCLPNTPGLPVIPIFAGVLLLLGLSHRAPLRHQAPLGGVLVKGISLGIVAALFAGLPHAAAIPFDHPYIGRAYAAYALIYVTVVSALVVFIVLRTLRSSSALAVARSAMLAVVALSVLGAIFRGEIAQAGAMAIGGVAGSGAALLRGWRVPSAISTRWLEVALIAGACAVRAVFGLQALARSGPGMAFALNSDDGDSYYRLASGLARDPGLLGDVLAGLAFPPAYSVFLASIFGATGESMAAVILAQALLGGLATWLVYSIARQLASRAVAVTAAVLFAFDVNMIQNSATVTAEALLIPLMLLGLWGLTTYRRLRDHRWLVVGALFTALVFVTRNVVAVPLLLAVLIWGARYFNGLRARTVTIGGVLLGLALVTLPIAVATGMKDGHPRITTQLASVSWGFSGGPGDRMSSQPLVELGIQPFTDPLGSVVRVLLNPGAVMQFYADVLPIRATRLFFSDVPGDSDPLLMVNPVKNPNSFGELIQVIRFGALGFACVVVARRWRTLSPDLKLIVTFVVLYTLVFTFVFAPYHAYRYRIPVEPFRFMAEAFGLVVITGRMISVWQRRSPAESSTSSADLTTP